MSVKSPGTQTEGNLVGSPTLLCSIWWNENVFFLPSPSMARYFVPFFGWVSNFSNSWVESHSLYNAMYTIKSHFWRQLETEFYLNGCSSLNNESNPSKDAPVQIGPQWSLNFSIFTLLLSIYNIVFKTHSPVVKKYRNTANSRNKHFLSLLYAVLRFFLGRDSSPSCWQKEQKWVDRSGSLGCSFSDSSFNNLGTLLGHVPFPTLYEDRSKHSHVYFKNVGTGRSVLSKTQQNVWGEGNAIVSSFRIMGLDKMKNETFGKWNVREEWDGANGHVPTPHLI